MVSMKQRARMMIATSAVAVLTIAGCSSSGSKGSTTAPSGSAAAPASSGTTASGTKASGTAIKIGFVDPVSGAQAFPSIAAAIKGGEYYVNNVLGGVNGHPLDISVCDSDGTPEKNVSCANNFVQDNVVAVVDGYDGGDGAQVPILAKAGIPFIGTVAGNDTINNAPGAYYFGPPDQAYAVGPLQVLNKLGAKSAALTIADFPAAHTYVNAYIAPVAKALGMTVSTTYYPVTNTNWSVIAATLASKHADVTGTISSSEGDATSLLAALKSVGGVGKILLGGTQDFIKDDGNASASGVYSYSSVWQPVMRNNAPPVIQKQIDAYTAAMKAAGQTVVGDQHGVGAFASIVNLATRLKSQTTYTAATATTALETTKNFQAFLGPNVTCTPRPWTGTSACTASILITQVNSDGTVKPALGSGFTALDPTLLTK
jgi:branched-chain amino acid transport system substrate-binding protein